MAYNKQNFNAGDILKASQLNAMDEQIAANEVALEGKQPKGDYLTSADLTSKQDKLVSGVNIKTVNGQSILGSGNIEILTSNSEQITNTIGLIGSPQVYTCDIKVDGLQVFSNVEAIYSAFDELTTLYPTMFKSNGSIGKDASGNYDIKYYTLGKTNPKITTDRVGNNANQWDDTKYLRKRIFINGNIHSWVERHCCYGLYLFVKELLESDEQWALFIKNNLVLDIVPQPNPWGYDNKTNVNKNNKNLNRYYLTNREPENVCIVNLIESLIPRGLIGIIDLHNTNDNTPGYTIGKTSQKYYNELCILASQIESITHKYYKDIYGSDRDSFYHMWNYDSAGINGLLNDYADTKGLVCYTSEVGTTIGEKGCIMTKMILVNTINALSNLGFINNENEIPDIPIVPDEPSTDPDEPETPDVEVGTDITSLFNWNNGGAIEATTINRPGLVMNTPLFNYTDYFDVKAYPDFRMSFVKWTSSTGTQPTLGYALYDENKNYISGVRFEQANATVGNSAGEVITINVHITDPSVAYMRTCYPADNSKYGTFSAVTIGKDDVANEPENPENPEKIDVTDLFTFTDGAAIETYTGNGNAGTTFTTSLFKYSDYVDVSEMPNFEMSFVTWRSGSGKKATLGYALYDENKNYVSGYAFELAPESVGNSAGEPCMIEVNVTDPNVKYIRTCYPTDETKYGEFKAYKIA
jgi:hypothetical protein